MRVIIIIALVITIGVMVEKKDKSLITVVKENKCQPIDCTVQCASLRQESTQPTITEEINSGKEEAYSGDSTGY